MMTISQSENLRLGVQSMLSLFHRHKSITSDSPAQRPRPLLSSLEAHMYVEQYLLARW